MADESSVIKTVLSVESTVAVITADMICFPTTHLVENVVYGRDECLSANIANQLLKRIFHRLHSIL